VKADLLEVAQTWLDGQGLSSLQAPVRQLSDVYRSGGNSSDRRVDVRAYMASRLPATYATIEGVLRELAAIEPDWQPLSLLDLGAGPGTASWAAANQWPGLTRFDLIERDPAFHSLALHLASQSAFPDLARASVHQLDLVSATIPLQADLVVASYVFIELEQKQLLASAERAWNAACAALVIVEPGTPEGFERLRRVRSYLAQLGASIIAPCPGNGNCPIEAPDWCHFAKRLARNRIHMHAKQAKVPFEDEKYCYLIATRSQAKPAAARVIRRPEQFKHGIRLKMCKSDGLAEVLVARRDKPAYSLARKLQWGDSLPAALVNEVSDDT
jgi:ribosomal protein RSM22 (predicted rRNA methylase)